VCVYIYIHTYIVIHVIHFSYCQHLEYEVDRGDGLSREEAGSAVVSVSQL
jgi:hypothetical protein